MNGRPRLSPLHQPPAWADEYVGIPWKNGGRARVAPEGAPSLNGARAACDGLDCWGLVRLIAAERFGAQLPAYDETTWRECEKRDDQLAANAELAAFMNGERVKGWEPMWEAAAAPSNEPLGGGRVAPGDVVLIRNLGAPIHVGVVVAPGHMLHIEEGIDAMCVEYDDAKTERRVIGFYRFIGRSPEGEG